MMRGVLFLILLACMPFVGKAGEIDSATDSFIFPPQAKHVHGSTLVALPNGDLLAAWFYGSGERKADDVCIMGARKRKGAKQWTQPFLMADTKDLPDCNPVLFLNQREELFLVWIAVQANRWEHAILRYKKSTSYNGLAAPEWSWQDNILLKPDSNFVTEMKNKFKDLPERKVTWAAYAPDYDALILEAGEELPKRSFGWMTRIKPLLLNGDTVLLPLYSDGLNFSLIALSDDGGDHWRPSLPIVGRGNIQPSLIQKNNGDLVAYMRDNGDAPSRIQMSTSKDRGATWTAAQKTDLPSTASVEVLRLHDGRWLMVANDVDDGRYRLALFVSTDEGGSWKKIKNLEEDLRKKQSFSYPALIQSKDDEVHISYSFKTADGQETIKYLSLSSDHIN